MSVFIMLNDLVQLKTKIETHRSPINLIENLTKGKNVLNVGAAGGVDGPDGYLPNNEDKWLHFKILKKAKTVIATDIDDNAIKHAKMNGYKIIKENCETMNLNQKFDIIVMSDVIEHLNAPVNAIKNLIENHLIDNGTLIITTPNGSAVHAFIRSISRRNLNIYYDHMAVYYPEHFQAICDRLGYSLVKTYLFNFPDTRSAIIRLKGFLFNLASIISPRLSSAMMVFIKKQ